ncbi:MAG: LLM class F420-dependent oxidoreductase [Candidatus Binatus sp.]|uniref:LLM class F420-dependent oxidoreductase n=1 Tax=Candidatus Binatus sp. TaxID=2811406 RepID=UPI002721CBE7|nr:LLM class F420-dependent oxidoreductase [Candidatus Binatus sp.]MDO8431486.1 LLM class F420-dependent oxidoreductase [Candidatus Binatus sp.]
MKLGLMFVNSGPFSNPTLLAHLATTAERCGIESLWTVEHVVIPENYQSPYPYSSSGKIPGGEDVSIPDPLLPLTFIAAITKKVKLATGVLILPQRHPLYVAKELATLDTLSNGRAILGIGSGWLKEEFDSLGLDFHTRGARTDESIKAMRALWSEGSSSFHGKHFNFGPVKCYPKPIQKGGVPIHIGGHSTAAAKRAGRYGDGFFPALGEIPKLKDLFAIMKAEAEKAGRNPASIELSCMGRPRVDDLKALQDIGISRVVIAPPAFDADGLTRGLEKLQNEVIAKI